jgi:hypothetical protein
MECIHLRAPNDRNGNPRRIYLCVEGGAVVAAIDEGYHGTAALTEARDEFEERLIPTGGVAVACQIDVTASEYNAWKRDERFIRS